MKKAPSGDGAFKSRTIKPPAKGLTYHPRAFRSFAFAQDDTGTSKYIL